ncbi:MAG: hypothetical protein ACNS61_12250 [Candidatus Wenzhouxiangella sp. M2_3B_020]
METSKISEGVPLDTVVRNVVASRRTVLPDMEQGFSVHEPTDTEALSEPYRAGLWRFPEGDYDREELLDAFENALRGPAKWARIRYHLCGDDRDDLSEDYNCEWEDVTPPRIIGSPPVELPGPTSRNE